MQEVNGSIPLCSTKVLIYHYTEPFVAFLEQCTTAPESLATGAVLVSVKLTNAGFVWFESPKVCASMA